MRSLFINGQLNDVTVTWGTEKWIHKRKKKDSRDDGREKRHKGSKTVKSTVSVRPLGLGTDTHFGTTK